MVGSELRRWFLPLPRAEDCRVRVVAEATERAPEERKYRRCVAIQKLTLDLDGSTTEVMAGILGSTQRCSKKWSKSYLALWVVLLSLCVRLRGLVRLLSVGSGAWCCRLRLLSGPVVWPCRSGFLIDLRALFLPCF